MNYIVGFTGLLSTAWSCDSVVRLKPDATYDIVHRPYVAAAFRRTTISVAQEPDATHDIVHRPYVAAAFRRTTICVAQEPARYPGRALTVALRLTRTSKRCQPSTATPRGV